MTDRTNPQRLAGTTIAAFLALSSTSVWAQEVPAPPAAAVAAPVAQPASLIVLPPVAAQSAPVPVIETAPVIDEVPTPRATAPRVAAARGATVTRPIAAPVARDLTAPVADTAPVTASDALPADLAGPPVATAEPASPDNSNDLLLAALAAALGLGAIGLAAATRRRRTKPDDTLAEYEPVTSPVEPVAAAPQRPATLVSPAFTPLAAWSEPRAPQPQPSDSRALNLNRAALLDRMVAAEPDMNNPFTSAKGRRRRARLMLQSMDNHRWEDAELAPGFDWREMAQATQERETVPT